MTTATSQTTPDEHQFIKEPNKAMILLAVPVLFSLIAEPITGLIDTTFITSLGVAPLAALGIGTSVLSLGFWVFNFLGVSTHTEVAQALGRQKHKEAAKITGLALLVALALGLLVIAIVWPLAPTMVPWAGASEPEVIDNAVTYVRYRLIGAPAVIMLMVVFGTLRGLQDMVSSMYIAIGINVLNIGLDWALIFGIGPFPEWGIAGAATASAIAQWIGVLWGIAIVGRKLGLTSQIDFSRSLALFKVGGDIFIRSGMLILFLFFGTRVANQMGAEAGAAHQVIRQLWILGVFIMEAFAETTQSLSGYFFGANMLKQTRRVAGYGMVWGVASGFFVSALLFASTGLVNRWMLPAAAVAPFAAGWILAVVSQPISSIAFITDGVLWGTGDYGYMRNGMIFASVAGIALLWLVERSGSTNLLWVWAITVVWIIIRAVWGAVRIWPGVGTAPLALT
ncbi:MAG: MATE family efflux transporter [Anaerolineae bacterium]